MAPTAIASKYRLSPSVAEHGAITASNGPPLHGPPPAVASGDARIVKKLVLRGKADGNGARYQLYLLVDIPPASGPQNFALLPDAEVKLLDWNIDALGADGGYAPLQESAARAGHYLGLAMSSTRESTHETSASNLRVIVSDYMITIAASPAPATAGESKARTYLVTLDLTTRMLLQPPTWHHMVSSESAYRMT